MRKIEMLTFTETSATFEVWDTRNPSAPGKIRIVQDDEDILELLQAKGEHDEMLNLMQKELYTAKYDKLRRRIRLGQV